jgi:PncC family amidohydrolase
MNDPAGVLGSAPSPPAGGQGVKELVEAVWKACEARGYQLAVAESCTGGGLAAAITDLPGVSSFFLGGIVSYANEVKMALLGVPEETLATVGAVSEETARAMASGVRTRLGSDVGVGITGIAGPGGETPTKPVGLVHISVATPAGVVARRDVWPGDRAAVRAASVRAALELILDSLNDRSVTRFD